MAGCPPDGGGRRGCVRVLRLVPTCVVQCAPTEEMVQPVERRRVGCLQWPRLRRPVLVQGVPMPLFIRRRRRCRADVDCQRQLDQSTIFGALCYIARRLLDCTWYVCMYDVRTTYSVCMAEMMLDVMFKLAGHYATAKDNCVAVCKTLWKTGLYRTKRTCALLDPLEGSADGQSTGLPQ